jgi:PAS domain S-box-containing protein
MPPYLLALAAAAAHKSLPYPWLFLAMTGLIFLGILILTIYFLRHLAGTSKAASAPEKDPIPRAQNEPAFMTASMQAVIARLREQEKELERLHKIERDRAESTARFSEEVTRNMPAGLLVLGANGLITSSNPAAEQALGIKTLAFRRYSEALGESSMLSALIEQCLAEGKIFRREQAVHLTPDGSHRELGVTISPIRRGQEKATGAICLLSDLTELSSLQKQMQLRENLAALGELSAGIAHEFKNALATISGYAQMIHSDPAALDTSENAAKILDQTRSVTHVVTEFMRYARPLEISAERVDLIPLRDRVVSEIQELFPPVEIQTLGTFAEVAGDEGLLRQALLNLVRNAVEAASAHSQKPRVTLRGELIGSAPELSQRVLISDNGPGIPAEVLPKLFLPFFTTKASGTGLGLAVVQKILLQHGGQIEARNLDQGGAEFILTLPAARQVPEAVESKEVAI